jgi:hypothetical protein
MPVSFGIGRCRRPRAYAYLAAGQTPAKEGDMDTTQIIVITVIVVAIAGGILAIWFRRRQAP